MTLSSFNSFNSSSRAHHDRAARQPPLGRPGRLRRRRAQAAIRTHQDRTRVGTGQYTDQRWRPQGVRVGWVDGGDVYLEPGAALSVAQDVARLSGGTGLPVGRTLHKRLAERQYLLSTGHDAESRQTFLVRRAVEGRRSDVLHLRATALTGESGQFGQFVTGTDNGPQPHNGAKPATGSPFDPDVESVSTQPKGGHP